MRCLFEAARCTAKLPASLGDMDILTLLDTIKNGKFALLGCSGPPLPLQRNGIAMPSRPELPRCGDGGGGGGGGDGIRTRPPPVEVDEEEVQAQPLALTMHNKPAAPSSAPVPMVTSPTGGGPPASPGKRKFTRPQADGVSQQGSVESEDEEDPATKASRLMPLNLSKSASVDYIREREKARGHSPLVRSASLPPRHLPGAYRYAGASSSPALAVSPNPGPSSPGEAARSGAPFLRAGTLPAFLLQQMRPSVITCAPGASTHRSNGRHVSRPISASNGLSVSHRREPSASMSSDPVVEEHFRRSLGRDYRDPAATVTAVAAAGAASCRPGDPTSASNRVSVTGSVDDHFMRALGDTWLRLRSPGSGSSGDDRSPHPASPPFPFSPPLTPSAAAAAAASSPPPPPLLLLPPPAVRSESGVRAYGGQTAAVSVSPHRSSHRAPSPRVLL
ncbi:transcription cofactor vestigial-like protein 4 isoform X2 [Lethenteron reissneri]|uniref:transcription cofactor vestigial-like protein 4 isoform X2 n=1 Tax=Lethenteron reissneri TaxID=7753 RepID=UPI002AB624BE|nr:transcription cofactor vestigial-like protein 4 isoform X2 [Lethenteron reissneri]